MKIVSLLVCIITLILINICTINSQQQQQQPKTITLGGYLYDHHPDINPNFEPDLGSLTKGIVKSKLNSNRVPELVSLSSSSSSNKNGRIVKPELFQYFFSASNGQNIEIPINLTLNYDSTRGIYSYTNLEFFPIDDSGFNENKKYRKFKDERGKERNFHMCLKINSNFKYNGNEIFNYASDDDLWVFINNKLELDLGGIHEIMYGSIDLQKLGLKINTIYPIDIFFCERHTIKSSIKIETNIFASTCQWYDYCGVCDGDGSTCCTPEIDCNDNDKCTTDKCPPPSTAIPSGKSISDYCIHTPTPIPTSNDSCSVNICDAKTGTINAISSCANRSNECLVLAACNSIDGCEYKSKCSKCSKCSGGSCVAKSQNDCGIELDGVPDPCMNYYCDQIGGCIKKPKCTDPFNNKCQVSKCIVNPSTNQGECQIELKAEIDDADPCTHDDCDPCSGLITHHYSNKCKQCTFGCN